MMELEGDNLTILAMVVGWFTTAVGFVWVAATQWAIVRKNDAAHREMLDDHEARLRIGEARWVEVHNDVKWIRQELERRG